MKNIFHNLASTNSAPNVYPISAIYGSIGESFYIERFTIGAVRFGHSLKHY